MRSRFERRVAPWHIDESDFYEIDSFDDQMRFLLQYAVLAPSSHNTQPWQFRIVKNGIEVFADFTRRLAVADPEDRELLISVGTAITNFRVAAAHFGYETTVHYSCRQEERAAVAVIAVRETCAPPSWLARLFRAITKRRTTRTEFDGEAIAPEALSRICNVIDQWPDTFRLLLPQQVRRVIALVEEGNCNQLGRREFRAELTDWICLPEQEKSDGVPSDCLGFPRYLEAEAKWLIRHFDTSAIKRRIDRKLLQSASALVLVTADDDRLSLIRTGEALELLLLTITSSGLHYSFANQPIEVASMRERIRLLTGATSLPQLLLRMGRSRTATRSTPRRELDRAIVS